MKMDGADGTASNFTAAHLKNPAASDFLCILKRIIITNHNITASSVDYYVNIGRKDTNLGGVADGTYAAQTVSVNGAEDGTGDSACLTATASPASASTDAPTVSFGKIAMAKKTTQVIRFDLDGDPDSGIVLDEGTGFVVKAQGTALTDLHVTFDWIEKRIV